MGGQRDRWGVTVLSILQLQPGQLRAMRGHVDPAPARRLQLLPASGLHSNKTLATLPPLKRPRFWQCSLAALTAFLGPSLLAPCAAIPGPSSFRPLCANVQGLCGKIRLSSLTDLAHPNISKARMHHGSQQQRASNPKPHQAIRIGSAAPWTDAGGVLQWDCRCSHMPEDGSGGLFATEPAFTEATLPLHAQLPEAMPEACATGRPSGCSTRLELAMTGNCATAGKTADEHRFGISSMDTIRATAGTTAEEHRLRILSVDAIPDVSGIMGSRATAGTRVVGMDAIPDVSGSMGSLLGGACQSPCGFIGGSLSEDLTRALEQGERGRPRRLSQGSPRGNCCDI